MRAISSPRLLAGISLNNSNPIRRRSWFDPYLVRSIYGESPGMRNARYARFTIRSQSFERSSPAGRGWRERPKQFEPNCPSGLGAPADDLNSTSRDNSNPIRRRPRFVVTIRSQSSLPRRGWRLTRIAQTIRTQFAHQGSARRPTISTQPAVTIRTQSDAGPGSSLQFVFTIRSQLVRGVSSPLRVAVDNANNSNPIAHQGSLRASLRS